MTTRRRIALGSAAVAAASVALGLWARQGADATPTSDIAVIESYTLLASQGNLLLGPYSRFQWHHPGPLYFFWMVPFYVLSGFRTTGLYAGALALNLLSLSLIVWVLARRAHHVVAITVCAALAVYSWRAAELLASPWNPHIPVLPMAALLLIAADVVSGSAAMLPLAAVIASLVGQTHIALFPSASAIGVCTVAAVFLSVRRTESPGRAALARIALATAAAVAACWMPSIIEQLSSRPGNMTLLWSYFMVDTHPAQSFAVAVSAWSDMLSGIVRPDFYVAQGWLFRESPVIWAELLTIAQLLGLATWTIIGYRTRQGFEPSLALILALSSAIALWSTTRVDGEIFDHGVFWMSGVGVLNTALLVSLVVRWLARSRPNRRPGLRTVTIACALLMVVATGTGVRELRHAIERATDPGEEWGAASAVAADLLAYTKEHRLSRPLIKIDQDAWGIAAGVILRLQKSQVPVAIEDDWIVMFTPAFAATGHESEVLTIAGKAQHIRLLDDPGEVVVVSREPIYVHLARKSIGP